MSTSQNGEGGGEGKDRSEDVTPTPALVLAVRAHPPANTQSAVDEADTDDIETPLRREFRIALELGREFYAPSGERLTSVDDMIEALERFKVLLAKPRTTKQRP